MKTLTKSSAISIILVMFLFSFALAQQDRSLQYFKGPDKTGINVFETAKSNTTQFNGLKVVLGGASTLQFQAINHSNSADVILNGDGANINELIDLASNFNLATANLDMDVQLEDGLRMHLRTYLSSRHHHETYVKGGYMQVDKLDFISEGFLEDLMKVVTLKVGHMEVNYGDAHFRRSDNAMTLYNPFVGNLIMDSFTTEVAGEIYYKSNGIIGMFGLSNGKLNQDVTSPGANDPVILGKLGIDRQVNPDLRVRLTGSIYTVGKAKSLYLYAGDRSGGRYYSVMQSVTAAGDDFRSGRWNPNFADKLTAIMVNPFVKYLGVEFLGTYERATGGDFRGASDTRTWTQLAGEAIYRFGSQEQAYAGIRYNKASGKLANVDPNEVSINRLQLAFGWFLTNNVLAKLEYVNQSYNDFASTNILSDGNFKGITAEAAISF
jgi:hypothetical protein